MPGELVSLRLLNSARGFSAMKHGCGSISAPGGIAVFSRYFPSRLRYFGSLRKSAVPGLRGEGAGVRRLSSGSFRSRNGGGRSSVGRSSDFSRRGGVERGEFQRGRGGQANSLIEDEDELSDWISGLKTDSLRVGLSSENDDSDREKDMSRGRNSVSPRRNQRDRRDEFSSSNRQRESDSDGFSFANRRNSQSTTGSFSKNSRFPLSNSVPKRRYVGKLEDDDDEPAALSPRRREYGSRGVPPSTIKRHVRDSESSYREKIQELRVLRKKIF